MTIEQKKLKAYEAIKNDYLMYKDVISDADFGKYVKGVINLEIKLEKIKRSDNK